ncbi:MAG: DUF1588 domain-containing protein [Myxococcales bacterium]|nr:DUF1588 domain-containing protein [Myxococcales bacterium]
MSQMRASSVQAMVFGVVAVLGAGTLGGGCAEEEAPCVSTYDYFATSVWPVVEKSCRPCHNPTGQAKDTSYLLKGSAEAGFLDHNLAVLTEVASFQKDGVSQILLKPSQQIAHQGGKIIETDGPEYKALQGFVELVESGATCDAAPTAHFTGVELLDDAGTLRKAALLLAARLPTTVEIERLTSGGRPELERILTELTTEAPFYDFVKRTYGDLFVTDFYLNNNANDLLTNLDYSDPYWFNTADKSLLDHYGLKDATELSRFTNIGITRAPVELVAHVVRNNRPFTEILTANYMMVTPLSARSYGITDATFKNEHDPLEFAEAHLPDAIDPANPDAAAVPFPHSGVLSSHVLLTRHGTTATNRNRARARKTILWFLGTNVLLTAEQPIDQTSVTALNPTREDSKCTVCHAQVDPIAGCFQAFDNNGSYSPTPTWYSEMWPAGFGDAELSLEQSGKGVRWLANQIAADDRFALSVIFNLYRGLTGREPLIAPTDTADPAYEDQYRSFFAQADTFRRIAVNFRASEFDLRTVVRELVLSPYFRAKNSVNLSAAQKGKLAEVGRAQLLAPEQLHDKLAAVLGIPWLDGNRRPMLRSDLRNPASLGVLQLLYGGVDSNNVTTRIAEPSGLMAAVAERMSLQLGCRAVPYDFSRKDDARLLFPLVTLGEVQVDPKKLEPETDSGLPIELAQTGIRETIVHLHARLLGQKISADSPDANRAYKLFRDTWREGNDGMKATMTPLSVDLANDCRVTTEFWSGAVLPMERHVINDDTYVIRAWTSVVSYLLGDYHFLYE